MAVALKRPRPGRSSVAIIEGKFTSVARRDTGACEAIGGLVSDFLFS